VSIAYDPSKDSQRYIGISRDTVGCNAVAITPSDTVDLDPYPKGIVVTAAGDLVVLPLLAPDDGAHLITFTGAPTGYWPPFAVRRVMATGTTASVATIQDF
jgi:hypothetical protein